MVTIESLDGAVLAQTTTDRSGNFYLPGGQLPTDFRVVGVLGSNEFSSEVRGYDRTPRQVILNVPNSLVSQAVQTGGLSLEQAESKVRGFLRYPRSRSLDSVGRESNQAGFSHLAFFQAAAQNGGWGAYRNQIVSRLPQAPDAPTSSLGRGRFAFDPALLDVDFQGLGPELTTSLVAVADVATYTALDGTTGTDASPDQYMGLVLEGLSDQTLNQLFPDDTDVAAQAVRGKLLESLADTVLEGAKSQLIDVGWTHIADALNLNYGTTRMLEEIQEQLDQVLSDLAHLEGQLDELAIEDTVDTLATAVANIQTTLSNLSNQDPSALGDPNTPYTPSSAVSSLIANLANYDVGTDLTLIQNTLSKNFFQNSVVSYVYNTELGVADISTYGNAPLLSPAIQSRILTPFNYYGQAQQSAVNILSETAHAKSPNPTSDMNLAHQTALSAAQQLKLQRGYIPQQMMTGYVVVDLQAGLMWYNQVFDATTWENAVNYAQGCQLDIGNGIVYKDWRVPTEEDFDLLQDRGRLVAANLRDSSAKHDGSDSSYGNYGYALQGLAALGFDKTGIETLVNSDGAFLCEPATMEDGRWTTYYYKYQLNHETESLELIDPSDKYPVLLVRSIGTNPVNFPHYGADSVGVVPFRVSSILPQEYPMLGYVSQVKDVKAVSGIMGATITYAINVGGSFGMGTNNQDSRKYPTASYSQDIDSFPGGSNDYSGPYDFQQMIDFESQDHTLLTIGATGKLIWHVDDVAQRSVQVVANVNSASGNSLQATGTISATPAARQITQIQIWPRNRYYSVTNGGTADESYYCLAYYDDDSIEDVTGQVVWSSNSPNSAVRFSPQAPNELEIDGTANPAQFVTVTATLNGASFTDSTGIEVISQ